MEKIFEFLKSISIEKMCIVVIGCICMYMLYTLKYEIQEVKTYLRQIEYKMQDYVKTQDVNEIVDNKIFIHELKLHKEQQK